MGNDTLIISNPGEVYSNGEIYSYEVKYFKPFKTTTNPKNLSSKFLENIRGRAEKAYRITGCTGYARVDFLLSKEGDLYVSEINTLPGFTHISMFPKAMEAYGIKYNDLITRIIELGLE